MSIKRERFWQYAKEAMLSASRAETERDKQDLLDLARTWAQAALVERRSVVDRDTKIAAVAPSVGDLISSV
jgi:hypothetical protein